MEGTQPSAVQGQDAQASTEPLIALSRVSKEYASGDAVVRALADVNLTIMPGEFVAIVGTSGSGKSTLMNLLGCLDRPTSGTYHLAGLDAGGRSNDARALIRNRLIGFIFQGFNLLPRTTALENCELPLQYRGIAAAERRRRATAALAAVGLDERKHHTPNQLSGGQQQRVAIARALVTDPPLLLADEPTGNLDTRTSLEVLALLQSLNAQRGITVCLVTHEHDIAACASRVITVRDGRIVSDVRQPTPLDAAAELRALPATEVAASRGEEQEDELFAARRKLGGPVPMGVYGMQALGLGVGALAGVLYDWVVLGTRAPAVVILTALLGDALFASNAGRRALGRPLTPDQRARVALYSTLAQLVPIALLGGLLLTRPKFTWLASKSAVFVDRGPVLASLWVVAIVVSVALLRYLLMALVSPRR